MSKTVFLDRDGTINREVGYCGSPERLELLPGAREAVQQLAEHGYRIIITTNQSGIARGLYGQRDLARVHEALHQQLGCLPFAYLHCPHHPDALGGDATYVRDCSCRKPKPGLMHEARDLLHGFGVAFDQAVVIGDSARDLLMARDIPAVRILVASGKPVAEQRSKLAQANCPPDHEAADLRAAVTWLLQTQANC